MTPSPHDPLSATLRQWRMQPPADAGFRTAVWSKIEAAPPSPSWATFAQAHPAAVALFLFTAVLAGAWSGRTQAREERESDRMSLASNYVRQLDARWMRSQ